MDTNVPKGLVLFATLMAGIFILLGFIVFFGGWSAAADQNPDEVWLQLMSVGSGAMPYFVAGAVFWLLAEYKTAHPN
jgi:hypothetical protein